MRKFVNALLFVAVMLSAASCITDARELGPDTSPVDKDVDIVLNLRTPGGFSAPRTRGLSYAQENSIGSIHVLVFDSDTKVLTAVRSGSDIKDLEDNEMTAPDIEKKISGSGSFKVTLPPSMGGDMSNLVVLANAGDFASIISGFTVDVTEYEDVIEALNAAISGPLYTSSPSGSPIPMWGETAAIPIAPATQIPTVKLMRAVARIDVGVGRTPARNAETDAWVWDGKDGVNHGEGNTIPFQLASVYVMRSNKGYALIPAPDNVNSSNTATAPTVPDGTGKFTAAESETAFSYSDITSDLYTSRSIYAPEADVIMEGTPGDADHKNRMAIVVGGKFDATGNGYDDDAVSYYRLDFANAGALMNVLHEHDCRNPRLGRGRDR